MDYLLFPHSFSRVLEPPRRGTPGPGSGLSQGCTETTPTGAVTPTANLELPICQMCKFLGSGWKRALGDHANSTQESQEIESLARTPCLCLCPVHFFNALNAQKTPRNKDLIQRISALPSSDPISLVVIIALYKLKYKGNLSDCQKS